MPKIVQDPDPILRAMAQRVEIGDIQKPKIQQILKEMKAALNQEEDGVAIAAPQINSSLRIFVISQKASKLLKEDTVFINPEIIRLGKQKEELSEGCLSVRWKYGLVKRATTATVRALNDRGHEFVINGRGLLAQIFQHEIDHLNGKLFTDKARQIEDLPPENSKKY